MTQEHKAMARGEAIRLRLLTLLIGSVVYAYAGYPALLWLVSRVRVRPVAKRPFEPSLSVVIPAYNEAAVIEQKLQTLLAQRYQSDKLEIVVASDGSNDGTNEIVERFADQGVRLLALPRGGKAIAINRAVEATSNEILVFTDADAFLAPDALRELAENFADPAVGGVSANAGRDPNTTVTSIGLGERLYWTYDKWLKRAESRIGSMVSSYGSLYAVRRTLFQPITDMAATDDFVISTRVVKAGYRLVFEPNARTWEPSVSKSEVEFNRKVRIVARGLRSVYGIRELLLPWNSGFYAVELWSHKIIRRLVGLFAVVILGLSLSLVRHRVIRVIVTLQALLYGLATLGWLLQGTRWGRKRWLYMPYYFCLSNVAATLGVLRFLRNRRLVRWEPQRDT